MMNHPSENSLGTLSYGVKTAHFIRQALAGFAGGEAIVSEMVQNADDASASRIEFKFTSDALVVSNDSAFTEHDFRNIGAIASGGKRDDEGKIGTWGIGFLSVYHITDAPELESAGRRIVFDPYQHELQFRPSDVVRDTQFRLPWRKRTSELSGEIEGRTWSSLDIVQLQKHLEASIYRLILFTRHVIQISVYVDDRLLGVVSRKKVAEEKIDDFHVETWGITYKVGTQHRDDTWLCYRAEVPTPVAVTGVTIKDREVKLAFPIKSSKWLDEQVPNVLYNFLPVPTIPTGLPFHINGAFFPDNNRNTVLLDERSHPERACWNITVLRTLGGLFLNALYDLRERVTEVESPRRFYELLPMVRNALTVGGAVSEAFLSKAGKQEIVWTSLGEWAKPRQAYVNVRGSQLPGLVSDYMPVLPTGKEEGAPQTYKDFLTDGIEPQKDRTPWLRWGEVFDFLQRNMGREVSLANAHPMVNTHEKLKAFYKLLDKEKISSEDRDKLRLTPLCLCEDSQLRRFKDAHWIEPQGRDLLIMNHGLPLVEASLLHKHGDIVKDLTDAFRGRELVQWLQQQPWPASPFVLGTTPLVRDAEHLRALLHFLDDDLDRVDLQKLNKLPLVLTDDGILRQPGSGLFIYEDEAVRRALTPLGFTFVHPDLAGDPHVREVYERMDVAVLTPQAVITRLGTLPESIPDEDLIALYDYFYRNRGQLQMEDKKRLQALALYRTQQERLAPLESDGNCLLLPPVQHADKAGITVLDKLGLDNTIHSHLANREAVRLFLTWLGAKERDPLTLIREEILPHYDDKKLDHTDRLALLHYISDTMRHYTELRIKPEGMPQLWQQLKGAPLIRCANGKYREGHKVNFASPLFERVFSGTYRHPDPQYEIRTAQEGDAEETPYTKSPWHWLFQALGVNATPTDADLVRVAEKITLEGPPTSERVQAVQRIYTYLNEELQAHLLDRREGLRSLARMEWLPARGDEKRWHRPAVMYPGSYENLIGEQAPLLPFRDPSIPLRSLLGMQGNLPAELVARHLLTSAERGAEVSDRVYQHLGRGWGELPQTIQSRLQKEPVIWEKEEQRYWAAEKAFFGDHRALYSSRRLNIDPPGGDIQYFFLMIGVKRDPQPWEDGVALLQEIASDYADGKPLDAVDLHLLHAQFDHLGYRLGQPAAQRSLARLRGVAFVPDTDARLHQPESIALADQPKLLDHFPVGTIPLVDGSDKHEVAESKLTHNGVRFLKTAGVESLSHLVHRYPEEVQPDQEDEMSATLQSLGQALQRIFVTYTDKIDEDRFEPIQAVQAWRCSRLTVRHVLKNDAGWEENGSVASAASLYHKEAKRLYFMPTSNGGVPETAIALELNSVFFPELTVSPVIEGLLSRQRHEWETYLDSHNFAQVHHSEAAPATNQGAMTKFSAPTEEGPSLFSEESEPRPDTISTSPATKQHELDLSGDGAGLPGDPFTSAQPSEVAKDPSDAAPSIDSDKDGVPIKNGTIGTDEASPSEDSTQDHLTESSIPDETQPEGEDRATDTSGIGSKPTIETPTQTSTDRHTSLEQEEVPAFTGQLRPPVVALPNNYSALRQRYRFPKNTDVSRPPFSKAGQADEDWKPKAVGKTSEEDRITQVRFTLHFASRYEGFLRLHARARNMLAGCPDRLRCLTDRNSEFELFADYEQGILYNQEALPAFFDQHNIPAGGIVYLERVHTNTIRLFWKQAETIITNVTRHETLEDGTTEEFVTPADRFNCEVDEAVYRAETRLEDLRTFFARAEGKHGILTTMCDAFGKAGRIRPYMNVLDTVLKERPAAEATVRWLLHQLDCFVLVEDDRWQFAPENGLGFDASDTGRTTRLKSTTPQQNGPLPGQNGIEKATISDPVATFLAETAHNLSTEVQRLRNSNAKPQDVLQQLVLNLRNVLQRLEQNLAALQTPSSANEPLIDEPEQADVLQNTIERAHMSPDITQRWQMLSDAWKHHQGDPALRKAIISALLRDGDEVSLAVDRTLEENDVASALAAFEVWRTSLHKLEDAWRESDEAVAIIGPIIRRLFFALIEEARAEEQVGLYRSALMIAALAPARRAYLNADELLEASTEIADELEHHADVAAAASLMEYAWHRVDSTVVSPAVCYRYNERLSTLWERLNQFHLALIHLQEAHKIAPSPHQRGRLAPKLHNLEERTSHINQEEEKDRLRDEFQRLVHSKPFMTLVSPTSFAELRRHLQ